MKTYLITQSADGAAWTTEHQLPSGKRQVLAIHLHSISAVGMAYDHAGGHGGPVPATSILSREPYQIRLTFEESPK
jgi:hypothetical protein